jgi:membrane protein YdbS with pleckstrin-like domain
MSRKKRAMNVVRIAITIFVLGLLTIVTLGWIWTGSHQPPPLRTASHIVLAIAALAGIFALAKIWRTESPR